MTPTNDIYLETLKKYWGYDSFRSIQRDIITSVCQGKDTLGLMPTGGGKSITFQVPTMILKGLCIVVTPLIALMKDQVSQLRHKGIKASAVYSGMMSDDIIRTLDNCILGNYKFLYISPERISSPIFTEKIKRVKHVCLICVDEAHCISQWGYDFRPSYLNIKELRNMVGSNVPVLALTATATPKVIEDIQNKLEFKKHNVFSMSFERKNLAYVVRNTENKNQETLHILKSVTEGSAIVYTRNRKATREIANFLNDNGISADNYHAGMNDAEKDLKQINWTKNRVRVMVATNAFGMGIDKADVRIVIHYNVPDSIESYFQEAGRAGRDGKKSYAILLYNPHDSDILMKRIDDVFPTPEFIRQTYENLCYFLQIGEGEAEGKTYDFSLESFCRTFKQFSLNTSYALNILTNAGYIDYEEQQEFKSRVRFTVDKEKLYLLNSGDSKTDAIIQAILRNYTGVFADYIYIDESLLSKATGTKISDIEETLKNLSKLKIISYIPHRETPTITFTLPRVDTDKIALSPQVYSDRKKEYTKRIKEIIYYITNENVCRSRILLNYFGESSSQNCGQCDVCISKKKKGQTQDEIDVASSMIIDILKDGEWHLATEMLGINMNSRLVRDTLRFMINEEKVIISGSKIKLAVSK